MNHLYLTKLSTILICTLILASSCKKNRLPQVDYADSLAPYHLHAILNYHDRILSLNDSVIDDFMKFTMECRENLPEMDNSMRWIFAISIDKQTPYHEIDSILRIIEKPHNFRIFLLVNNIKDTVGFTMSIPLYSHDFSKNYPDTLFVDNLIELKENVVNINGRKAESLEIDYLIREMVFKKKLVTLAVSNSTQYESFIKILSTYHKYRQHFKELYSELNFNTKYSRLDLRGNRKWEVDDEYRSGIGLFDPGNFIDITIIVDDRYVYNYAP